jgi:hypothetical protein
MASLFQMANLTGSMLVRWRNGPLLNQPVWRWVSTAFAVICVLASLAIAGNRRWQRPVIAVCVSVGVCLSLAALFAQSSGLQTANPQMASEIGLNAPFSIVEGMLISAAPAAILALRIGRMGLSRRRVMWAGLWGVWFPLLASVALVSLAKMCGARLYWKPSLPIGFTYAFVWLLQVTDRLAAFLCSLAVTILGPCVVCAVWVLDLTRDWVWRWPKFLVLAAIAITAYAITSSFVWALYYRYWLWSIVGACTLLGLARLMLWTTRAISTKPH